MYSKNEKEEEIKKEIEKEHFFAVTNLSFFFESTGNFGDFMSLKDFWKSHNEEDSGKTLSRLMRNVFYDLGSYIVI